MLLPRYSIRWILVLTTLCAFFFIVIAQAVRGQSWAIAITGALAMAGVCFVAYGLTFLLAYTLARSTRALTPPTQPTNPFVTDGALPPQIVPKGAFGAASTDET